jgi:DNA-binding NarL/FixJ family response regulator
MGFVPKRASNETLTEALHVVMSGGIYVPPMTTMAGIGTSARGSADVARDPACPSRRRSPRSS